MKFDINDCNWTIRLVSLDELNKMYINTHDGEFGKELYTFGYTCYFNHVIYINKEVCSNQLYKTLRHELTHAYLWSVGYQYDKYDEEDVCNIASSINELLNVVQTHFEDYFLIER